MWVCINWTSLQYYQRLFLLISLPWTWVTHTVNLCFLVFNLICLNLHIPARYIFWDQLNYWTVLRVDVTLQFWILLVILKTLKLSPGVTSSTGQLHSNNYHCLVNLFIVFHFFSSSSICKSSSSLGVTTVLVTGKMN